MSTPNETGKTKKASERDAWIIATRQWGEPQPLSIVIGTKADAEAKAAKMRAPNSLLDILVIGPYDVTKGKGK